MSSHTSPSSSPNASKPLTTLLSPRSNLRKLLAGIDDSSDEEDGRVTHTLSLSQGLRESTQQPSLDDEDDSEQDDDAILRPRGRLASRMQLDTTKQAPLVTESAQGARDRVKAILGLNTEKDDTVDKRTTPPLAQSVEAESGEDADEDDIRARHTRRPKVSRLLSRTATPERDSSPDLFVTPSKEPTLPIDASDDDQDLTEDPTKSRRAKNRLLELQKKRISREAAEQEKKKNNKAHIGREGEADAEISGEESDNITDDDGGRRLTQEAATRPSARKASKKALEDMHRETQRLSRNLQLSHEAKTKKKITKASLFERFNFKPASDTSNSASIPPEQATVVPAASSSRPPTPVSAHNSDVEMHESPTPPSSPPVPDNGDGPSKSLDTETPTSTVIESRIGDDQDPQKLKVKILSESENQVAEQLDKGKGKATATDSAAVDSKVRTKRNFRVTLAKTVSVDSDEDDLLIVNPKKSKLDAMFESIPARRQQGDGALRALRVLAQLGGSPSKEQSTRRRGKFGAAKQPTMTAAQLQLNLHQRAREQARVERERRFDALRAKGVHIQTEEERERERQDVEDIVAAARREADEIMKREKEEGKAERKQSGVVDPLDWDDSDEEGDYIEEPEEQSADIELSGSEGEEEEQDADVESGAEDDNEAGSDVDSLVEQSVDEQDVDMAPQKPRRAKNQAIVLSDDEDEDDLPEQHSTSPTLRPPVVEATPKSKTAASRSPSTRTVDSPFAPKSVLRSATKTFIPGLPVKAGEAAGLGLTQIFAGTMDDSQVDPFAPTPFSQPRPTFDAMPQPTIPQASIAQQPESSIMDTQLTQNLAEETQGGGVNFEFDTQSQMHGLESLMRDDVFTQASQFPEATQDGGFQGRTPLRERFIDLPQSTVDTVAVDGTQSREPSAIPESPIMQRGRLRRKLAVINAEEEDDVQAGHEDDENMADEGDNDNELVPGTQEEANAFSVLNKAAVRKEKQEAFDRKKSKAKEMFQEQADESEDEYAGLGGADVEDSDDDGEDVKDMIDDHTKASEAEKAKIAAIYADRERADDEKQVEKLFRDITSGMLRRKRGADYGDLSDEDDGGEARRRMKRQQFAKMQKALFADERVSKVAENPRTSAFMRTIEDRSDDEDMLDILAPSESQQDETIPDSQASAAEGLIPKASPAVTGRLPGPQRRRKDLQKPANLGEVRESLSDLLEDHISMGSVVPATGEDSDSDDAAAEEEETQGSDASIDDGNKENRNPRRRAAEVAVVDRISLKRSGSSVSSGSNSEGGVRGARTAFVASSGSGTFKVPALLRRATTNSSLAASGNGVSSSTGSSISRSTAGAAGPATGDEASKVKKNASKRSGINYFARENDRLAALAERERRREQRKCKGAEGRSKVVGSLFAAGKFE